MSKGISLHIGMNSVDPNHYDDWDGKLNACENDAKTMQEIADAKEYESKIYLSNEATRQIIIKEIEDITQQLDTGDIFMFTFSGHGGQVPDYSGDERDFKDETILLYDGQLIDDELYQLWSNFKEGVRILVLSDSCHSGTMIKAAHHNGLNFGTGQKKFMPDEIAFRTYEKNKSFYDEIAPKTDPKPPVKATVRLISGCQDNQYSYDGTFNSTFTAAVKRVWAQGNFKGDYGLFHKEVVSLLPPHQSPNHKVIGTCDTDYDNEKPFTI